MFRPKKVTAQVYVCAKANLDNGCRYKDARMAVYRHFNTWLGDSTLGLIKKSVDYDEYFHMKKNGRKETRLGEIDTFKIYLSSDQPYHFNRVEMTLLITLCFLLGCLISLYIL